jgi:hypothetical protein
MRHVLLRARKDTFEVLTPTQVMIQNAIGENAGNLIFSTAAQRILETRETTVTADRFKVDPGDAARINERYDAYVIPLANAFRLTFAPTLVRMTALIRQLRIPVVILGVGTQATVDNDTARLDPIAGTVKDFVSAVLDRGPSIGVRGEYTRDYLVDLGFRDVEVIGCPSLFIHGSRLDVVKRRPTLDTESRVVVNVSPYVKRMAPILQRHVERYPNLTYIPQDVDTLELLLWGDGRGTVPPDDPRPIHDAHRLFREDKVRFFVDPAPWFDYLATQDFSFGTRIHGNIAALIAGTPAYVLAHDSRTVELARYFEIPHRLIGSVDPNVIDAAELYAQADYGPLVRGHADRFERFLGFVERHGLEHAFGAAEPEPSFAARLAATPFPPAVTVASRTRPRGVRDRLRRQRSRIRRIGRRPMAVRVRTLLARVRHRATSPTEASGPAE